MCTTDRPTRRELGRERESSERGRYRRPPTEAHRTVLRPPAPNPGRSSGTILGRGEEGRERCIREASTASSMLDPRRSPRLAGLCLGGLSRLPQGCTWRSYPSTALNAPPPRPPHTHPREAGTGNVERWRCSWQFRAKAEFSQLPRVFLCLHAGAWQLFLLNGTLSRSKFNCKKILLKIKAQLSPLRISLPVSVRALCSKGRGFKVEPTMWGSWKVTLGRRIDTRCRRLSFKSPYSQMPLGSADPSL